MRLSASVISNTRSISLCRCSEKETSEGRIDCVLECPDYVYILEFKLNGSAAAALKQIDDNGYAKPYIADRRKVICLGINFSSEKGTIDDWKLR